MPPNVDRAPRARHSPPASGGLLGLGGLLFLVVVVGGGIGAALGAGNLWLESQATADHLHPRPGATIPTLAATPGVPPAEAAPLVESAPQAAPVQAAVPSAVPRVQGAAEASVSPPPLPTPSPVPGPVEPTSQPVLDLLPLSTEGEVQPSEVDLDAEDLIHHP